jgi:cytochrome oxidase Cu insertion factor (SCO1/SenC/PrrC family)
MRTAGLATLALLLLGATAHDPASLPEPDAPKYEAPAPGSYELPAILHVEERSLVGTAGEPEALLGIGPGEVAVVSFVYLSCGEACPLATAALHRLDTTLAADPALAERVRLVTVSFDPERDTPEAMAAFAASLRPKGRWSFLTSRDPDGIAPVLTDFGQDAVRLPGKDGAPGELRHVLKVFLVDARGDVRNVYSTGLLDLRLVRADIETVLGEHGPISRRPAAAAPAPRGSAANPS